MENNETELQGKELCCNAVYFPASEPNPVSPNGNAPQQGRPGLESNR